MSIYEFRKLRGKSELVKHYRARYRKFLEIGWRTDSEQEFDFDVYDFYSCYIGAVESETGDVVGALRKVNAYRTVDMKLKQKILDGIGFAASKEKEYTFPLQTAHGKRGETTRFLREIVPKPDDIERVVEVGGLFVLSEHSGTGINKRLHEEVIAHSICDGDHYMIIACHPKHYEYFYRRLGFVCIPGTTNEYYPYINALSHAYVLDMTNIDVLIEPDDLKSIERCKENIQKSRPSILET